MWEVKFTGKAEKQFSKLPRNIKENIAQAIREKLSVDPDLYLSRLSSHMKNYYKFRVNDYRLLCVKLDKELVIAVIAVGHRKDIYRIKVDWN